MVHQSLPLEHVPYTLGPGAGSKASIMLTHFDGAIDAGFAGRIAVDHLLRALPTQRVVTFSTDSLLDYRSHRPVLTVENWVSSSIDTPTVAIDLVHDDAGKPLWILHGPEPDLRWEAFAGTVSRLAQEAGVELAVSLHGMPSSVPHTRPVQVHAHATNTHLLPQQPDLPAPMQVPAALSAFVQMRLHAAGIEGMALLPTVPYYVADSAYPPAASTMLRHLSSVTGLALPVGELEQGSQTDRQAIDQLVEKAPEIAAMIGQLESTFDDLASEGKLPHLPNAWDIAATELSETHGAESTESVEAFLENIARLEANSTKSESQPPIIPRDEDNAAHDTIEAVLRRIDEREKRRAAGLPPLAQPPLRRRDTDSQ